MNYNSVAVQKLSTNQFIKSGGYNSYISKDSQIDYEVKIQRNCLIDSNVKISEHCEIQNSVILKDT